MPDSIPLHDLPREFDRRAEEAAKAVSNLKEDYRKGIQIGRSMAHEIGAVLLRQALAASAPGVDAVPATDPTRAEAARDFIRRAYRILDWMAGEGMEPADKAIGDPANVLLDTMRALGVPDDGTNGWQRTPDAVIAAIAASPQPAGDGWNRECCKCAAKWIEAKDGSDCPRCERSERVAGDGWRTLNDCPNEGFVWTYSSHAPELGVTWRIAEGDRWRLHASGGIVKNPRLVPFTHWMPAPLQVPLPPAARPDAGGATP